MNKRLRFLVFTILFFTWSSSLYSQSVNGYWYGVGSVQTGRENAPGTKDNYLAELQLHQKGKTVKGKLNYYFKDSLFVNNIEGTFDAGNRRLILHRMPVIFYGSTDIRNGVDCYMTGDFTLRISKIESVLSGVLLSDEVHRYVAAPIQFSFKKSTDTAAFVLTKEPDEPSDSVSLPKSGSVKTPVEIEYEKRELNITKEITVSSPIINLELYDNGIIDYDSVTVFVNGKVILPKSMLSHKAIKLAFRIDEKLAYTDVSMFANNEGMVPPNTAALILYDGNKRYEIQMSSSLSKTAFIRLRKEKPNTEGSPLQK